MLKKIVSFVLLNHLILSWIGHPLTLAKDIRPKYGPLKHPKAVPLWSAHQYFSQQKEHSPLFWPLISFYIPQSTPASCFAASLTMTLNAARTRLQQTSEDAVLKESTLLDAISHEHWKERMSPTGYQGKRGVDLELARQLAEKTFRQFGFPKTNVISVHMDSTSSSSQKTLGHTLHHFTRSTHFFIIANFDQKAFTDDTHAGHFAPVGAFNRTTQEVLILDPDREYFSPYWISKNTFLEGMSTLDSTSHQNRGYLVIQLNPDGLK